MEWALLKRVRDLSVPGSHVVVERTVSFATLVESDNGKRLREISERAGVAMDQLLNAETDRTRRLVGGARLGGHRAPGEGHRRALRP